MQHTRITPYLSLVLAIVLAANLVACAAAQQHIVAIGTEATLQGMISCAKAVQGTFIYADPARANFMMGWPYGAKDYAFVVFRADGAPIVNQVVNLIKNGQKVDVDSISGIIKAAEANGWTRIMPGELPVAIYASLTSKSAKLLLTSTAWAKNFTTIFLVPAGTLKSQPWKPVEIQQ